MRQSSKPMLKQSLQRLCSQLLPTHFWSLEIFCALELTGRLEMRVSIKFLLLSSWISLILAHYIHLVSHDWVEENQGLRSVTDVATCPAFHDGFLFCRSYCLARLVSFGQWPYIATWFVACGIHVYVLFLMCMAYWCFGIGGVLLEKIFVMYKVGKSS